MKPRIVLPAGILLAACGSDRSAPAAAGTPPPVPRVAATPAPRPEVMVRGTVFAGGEMTFRACDQVAPVRAVDSTGGRLLPTYRFLRPPDDEGLFIMARATESSGGPIILRELEFARRPVPGDNCDEPAPDYLLRARGINPNWRVTITASGIEFAQDSEPRILVFPPVTPDDSGGVLRYRTGAQTDRTHRFHLLLVTTSCSEGNNGVYAAMQAALTLDGRALSGCAWRGRQR
ncbi:MAG TPA: hypothetical protein VJ817_00930 [Gemmatimonadales bacterium]|nr:hypothetical protein [Gemmatimonadales bacterium]